MDGERLMRFNKTIALACAISAAVAISGCHRDEADETDHATATIPAPAPAPASTISSATPSTQPFDQMDKNHDGGITSDELDDSNPLKQHFPEADTNGDGKLSPDEVTKYNGESSAKPDG
jgi:hypothetical protein